MSLTSKKRWLIQSSVVVALISGGLFAACSGEGPPRPTCEPLDRSDAGNDIGPYTNVPSDAQPPEAFGQEEDPGPQCLDCTKDRDFDILTVVDFENGFAPAWFNYGEPGIFLEPPSAGPTYPQGDGGPVQRVPPPYWGLQAESLADAPGGVRCGSEFALHMAGGRFTQWGGGFVTRLVLVRGDELIEKYCKEGKSESNAASVDGGIPEENGIGGTPRYMMNGLYVEGMNDGETVMKDQASGCFFYISPGAAQPSRLGLDVSQYDGISFWARRGPSGQSTLRVALVDDNTSEDRALQMERQYWLDEKDADRDGVVDPDKVDVVVDPDKAGAPCKRVKGCCRHCAENLEFQEYIAMGRLDENPDDHVRTSVQDRCWVEGEPMPEFREGKKVSGAVALWYGWDFRVPTCGPVPTTEDLSSSCWVGAAEIWDQWNRDHALCCPRTMDEELDDPVEANGDPRYGSPTDGGVGTRCRPYVFHYDQSSGNYCYRVGEVLPEKNQNRCGEGFESALTVDTEWKFFTIPWDELRRFTPDKPPINPGSIWMLSFYFSSGYLDMYIDDIGFYRRRK